MLGRLSSLKSIKNFGLEQWRTVGDTVLVLYKFILNLPFSSINESIYNESNSANEFGNPLCREIHYQCYQFG